LALPLLLRHVLKEKWSKVEYVLYTLPFFIPFPLAFAVTERKLLTASALLLALAVIGLPVLMAVFVFGTLWRPHEETAEEKFFAASVERWQRALERERHFAELKGRILKILAERRDAQLPSFGTGGRDTDEYMVTGEELNNRPELREESQALINRAVDELVDAKRVFRDYHGYSHRYYLVPGPQEIDRALAYARGHSIIVFRANEGSNVESKDLRLTGHFAAKFGYPGSVIARHMLEPLRSVLRDEYLSLDESYTNWEIHVRRAGGGPRECLDIWRRWYDGSYRLALETGMEVPDDIRPSYLSIKWHLQQAMMAVPAWESVVTGDPVLKKLLSGAVLPEGFQTELGGAVDLYDFFYRLENLLPAVEKELETPGTGGTA